MHGMMPMVFLVLSEREHSPVAGVQRPSPVPPRETSLTSEAPTGHAHRTETNIEPCLCLSFLIFLYVSISLCLSVSDSLCFLICLPLLSVLSSSPFSVIPKYIS